jgi:hypothetical protein
VAKAAVAEVMGAEEGVPSLCGLELGKKIGNES